MAVTVPRHRFPAGDAAQRTHSAPRQESDASSDPPLESISDRAPFPPVAQEAAPGHRGDVTGGRRLAEVPFYPMVAPKAFRASTTGW